MSGWLRIVGLGPGPVAWLTPQASDALHAATDIVGYAPYVACVPLTATGTRHASGNCEELERARHAFRLAMAGKNVAVVSGGDAGVFGMASAVFEAMEHGDCAWRTLDVQVLPGMTAVLAAAARAGAPLGHDFCVLSLSDRLKPWPVIERRLRAASDGDFVLALYNPASNTRQGPLIRALALLRALRGNHALTCLARDIGRAGERMAFMTLGDLNADEVDMRTLLIVGSSRTRLIERPGLPPLLYTPRFYEDAP